MLDIETGKTCVELKGIPRAGSVLLVNDKLISFDGHELQV